MPCRDYDYGHERRAENIKSGITELRVKLDNVTNMLCTLCKRIEEAVARRNLSHVVYEAHLLDNEIRNWWETHKENDRIRKAELRKIALAKLTAEEIEALSIPEIVYDPSEDDE